MRARQAVRERPVGGQWACRLKPKRVSGRVCSAPAGFVGEDTFGRLQVALNVQTNPCKLLRKLPSVRYADITHGAHRLSTRHLFYSEINSISFLAHWL